MRRWAIFGCLMGFLTGVVRAACDSTTAPTYTSNMGLALPVSNACGWGTTLNGDFSILDSSVPILGNSNQFTNTNSFSNTVSLLYTPIRFFDASLGRYVSLNVPATVTTTNFFLPSADGVSGQVIQTNGAGQLSFVTPASGGSGSSVIAVGTGTLSSFNWQASSPTSILNFNGAQFTSVLSAGTTNFTSLNASSVTLQGNSFNQASQLVRLDASSKLPAVDGSQLTGVTLTGVLRGGATSYWNNPSTNTFTANYGITGTSVTVTSVTITNLNAGQCVQTSAGGLLGTSGTACGGPAAGLSTQVQYNNGGAFAGTALETVGTSSVAFNTVSSATYTGFSSMTMTGMLFNGNTSSITFSSATFNLVTASSGTIRNFTVDTTLGVSGNSVFYGNFNYSNPNGQDILIHPRSTHDLPQGVSFFSMDDTQDANINNPSTSGSYIWINAVDEIKLNSAVVKVPITGSIQCMQLTSVGTISGTGVPCPTSIFNTTATSATVTGTAGFRVVGAGGVETLASFDSLGATDDNSIKITNGTGTTELAQVGGAGSFFTGTVAGDVVLRSASNTKTAWVGGGGNRTAGFNSNGIQIYQGALGLFSRTVAQLQTTTPPDVGQMYYCSNCTALRVCISTGTAQGAFSSPVAATTACN